MKKCCWFTFLALPLLAAGCIDEQPEQISNDQAEILGGQAGTVGQYPTTVAITNNGLCTGTLIAPDLILTAAHCITASLLRYPDQAAVTADTQVVFDSTNVQSDFGIRVNAADTIPHPSFSINSLGDNDIGLIRLSRAMTDRTPTPINRINRDAQPGISLTQVGYGVTNPANQASAGGLYVLLDKPSVSCPSQAGSNANLICFSQSDGTGKCQGDSGGPSYATIGGVQRVVGVTSFGDQNCAQFGADTRVDAELDFLFQHEPNLQCQADGACADACGKGDLAVDPDCDICTEDTECDGDDVCDNGQCVAPPFSPGGLGSACADGSECDSTFCANSAEGGRCTSLCDDQGASCPSGFDCISAGGDTNVCWENEGGGCCSASGDSNAPLGAGLLFGLIGLVAMRRRKRS